MGGGMIEQFFALMFEGPLWRCALVMWLYCVIMPTLICAPLHWIFS